MISLLRTKASDLAPFHKLLRDKAFWRAYEEELTETLTPLFQQIFLAGAETAAKLPMTKALLVGRYKSALPNLDDLELPLDLVHTAEQAMIEYMPKFIQAFAATTYDSVKEAVIRAQRDGSGAEGVQRTIGHLFSKTRARAVAVTETTRLYGLGAQATYKEVGLKEWEWMTVKDSWVCPTCRPRHTKRYPLTDDFDPGHPRCRCFPRPVALKIEDLEPPETEEEVGNERPWAQPIVPASQSTGLLNIHKMNTQGRMKDELFEKVVPGDRPNAVKDHNVKRLHNRLKDDLDWNNYVNSTASSSLYYHKDSYPDTYLHLSAVNELLQSWALSSFDSIVRSIAMQRAVIDEFGLSGKLYDKRLKKETKYGSTQESVDKLYAEHGTALRKFAREMYKDTQEIFSQLGVEHVYLYRGMKGVPKKVRDDNLGEVELQPISSFSTSRDTASSFAGSSATASVLHAVVPVSRIIGTAVNGYGCLNEFEYVVLSGPGMYDVTS